MVPPTVAFGVGTGVVPPTFPPDQLAAVGVPLAIMPGAPPVRLASVAVIWATPFSEKVSVLPAAVRVSWVPAGSTPLA